LFGKSKKSTQWCEMIARKGLGFVCKPKRGVTGGRGGGGGGRAPPPLHVTLRGGGGLGDTENTFMKKKKSKQQPHGSFLETQTNQRCHTTDYPRYKRKIKQKHRR